jgi:uncharacterized protein involved in exopolysaccharide biosynthesis
LVSVLQQLKRWEIEVKDLSDQRMSGRDHVQGMQPTGPAESEVSVLDIMIVIARRKRTIIWVPVAAALIAAAVSLTLPEVYKATTKLMPPQQNQSSASAMLSQLSGMAGLAGVGGAKNQSDVYIGMLQSRTLADRLIEKFNLKKVYGTESQEQARGRLQASTTINVGKDGLISIDVDDTDKKLVAPLANAYVGELMQLTKVLAVSEAGQRRVFYERQLEQAKDNLAKAEAGLKDALDSRGVISVDVESQAVLETVGRLRAQASAKEIQLSSMRAFLTPNNPQYKRVEEELGSLRAELGKLENGRGGDVSEGAAAKAGKQGGFENIKLLRDVKYNQMLYEILAKQYEAARLDEAKDPTLVQVLDPAVEPERKFKPRRSLIVALSAIIALFGTIGWSLAAEAHRKLLLSETGAAQWRELRSYLGLK